MKDEFKKRNKPSVWEGTEGGYLLRMHAGLLLKPLEAIAMECV